MNKCSKCGAYGARPCEGVVGFGWKRLEKSEISQRNRFRWENGTHERDRTFDRRTPNGSPDVVEWFPQLLCETCINFFKNWVDAENFCDSKEHGY